MTLPVVLTTSVIRGAQEGSTHGGLYRIDLESGAATLVREWDDPSIAWGGRGGERGLRGVGVLPDGYWAAAANSLLHLDPDTFETRRVFEHPHLGNNHELWVDGTQIHLTSTAFDRFVRFDTERERFVESTRLRKKELTRIPGLRRLLYRAGGNERIRVSSVDHDPSAEPETSDQCHLNSIRVTSAGVEVCGTKMRHIMRIDHGKAHAVARVPRGTHNALVDRGELIFNDTRRGKVVLKRKGGTLEMKPPHDPESAELRVAGTIVARPNFCRGLVALPDVLIAGSSPATVTVYDRHTGAIRQSVQLSDEVANAIHGIVVAPASR